MDALLLETFNAQNITDELNFICSFNKDGKYDALFNGVNHYQFMNIQSLVGHPYMSQIIINTKGKSVGYFFGGQKQKSRLKDLTLVLVGIQNSFLWVKTNLPE